VNKSNPSRHEEKTPEEKELLLSEALSAIRGAVTKGLQGNITLSIYKGIVGPIKFELWVDPAKVKKIFNLGGDKNANAKLP
jgi:hypothetical protein